MSAEQRSLQGAASLETAGLAALEVELADTPYRPIAPLGKGAMGFVFEVEHKTLKRKLVIKVLREPNRPDLEDRLRLEAQALAQLSHPNVLAVVDYAHSASGHPFIVSERLFGKTLKEHVGPSGALPVSDAVRFVCQTLAGLSAAHRAGIVHRDIKLDNLFLTDGDQENAPRVVVIDFGIAKLVGAEAGPAQVAPLENPTAEGIMVGTPSFMSPEQVTNQRVDHRADIYGAGVVLYRLLAGRSPFICKDLLEYATAHATEPPLPPSRFVALPHGLDAVVLRALEKHPEQRFASAKEMIDALEAFLRPDSGPITTASPIAASPVGHSPESMPTHPLAGRSVKAEQAKTAVSRSAPGGTEMMMEAPPAHPLGIATPLAQGGTMVVMDSPQRGTQVYSGPPAGIAPTALDLAPPGTATPGHALPLSPHPGPPPGHAQPLAPRSGGWSKVELSALAVALLATVAILWFSARLLLAAP